MRRGKRTQTPAPAEQTVGSSGTYRVAVAHTDPEHTCSERSHWGPAYDAGYAETTSHVREVPVETVDLLHEALRGAARARDEYSGMDGWEIWVEKLGSDGWERVE